MSGWIPARLVALLDTLRASYWFVPGLLVLVGIVLSIACTQLDRRMVARMAELEGTFLFIGQPASARAILTTIAGSMITIASLTFSITIVALTMAATSFGSRLLYNFMRDRGNQVTLGVFLGTFAYCAVVLRAVDAGREPAFVPHLSVFAGFLLALLSIGVLIYFIHHVAESIQAETVVAAVGRELHRVVDRFFPPLDEAGEGAAPLPDPAPDPATITGDRDGVLQALDLDRLAGAAKAHDVVLRMCRRPGDYVIAGTAVATAHPRPADAGALAERVCETMVLGRERTLIQDVEFAFLQLVELAVRALSPGVNDPFTAIACIDELGAGLAHVMRRAELPGVHADEAGDVRVVLDTTRFRGIVDVAFDQIRQHGARDVAAMIRLLETIEAIVPLARTDEQRAALVRQARLACAGAAAEAGTEADREDLRERYRAVQRAR